jgi:hypothetical protein
VRRPCSRFVWQAVAYGNSIVQIRNVNATGVTAAFTVTE